MRRGVRVGVDVGSVRVGVARCDPDGILATPVETLRRASPDLPGSDDADLQALTDLVRSTEALEVIVGLPVTLAGEHGPAARAAVAYATALGPLVAPTPVRLVDERLTTVDAQRALRDSGVGGRAARQVVDQAAAVLILQSALDLERSTGRPPGRPLHGRKPRMKDGRR
ncbi:MAG: Holliday junction resolvase RuvX [Phycicoccus sp.]|nr:Holliday junction resolvase RuvX [Phycicoccus sp.]